MTRDAAEKVIQALLSASGPLNDALRVVEGEASETVFEDYRRRTAEAMAAIYLDLVKPIVEFYPDLDPGR
jgi:hypothetical protein